MCNQTVLQTIDADISIASSVWFDNLDRVYQADPYACSHIISSSSSNAYISGCTLQSRTQCIVILACHRCSDVL